MADLTREMYEDMLVRRGELRSALDDAGRDAPQILAQINAINTALGEKPEHYDPLAEKWERELEQGLIPDLDEDA